MTIAKVLGRALAVFVLIVGIAAAIKWWQDGERIAHARSVGWHQLPRHETQLLPNPKTYPHAVVAVLAAPTYGWRGYFAVHPWLVYKRPQDATYTRYEVIGWSPGHVVRRSHSLADSLWYGATPELLTIAQGPESEALIEKIEQAIGTYPYPDKYRSFPGPNSNTFLAHIGRSVPELGLDLPPTAIGKDYRPLNEFIGVAPSGRGLQLSVQGLLGVIVSPQEGLELNLFGLGVGIDLNCPAFRLPFVGRLGLNGTMTDNNGCGKALALHASEGP